MNQKSYTKKGDDGHTLLGDGTRRPKSDKTFKAIGMIDELSSIIGIAKSQISNSDEQLKTIQQNLVLAGGIIASYLPITRSLEFEEKTTLLEKQIDEMDSKLPKIHKFILPGGSLAGAHLHLARTTARKAERRIQELNNPKLKDMLMYFNRLSSYFFTRSRLENQKSGINEEEYSRL